jgi:hypothetical protein
VPLLGPLHVDQAERVQLAQTRQHDPDRTDHRELIGIDGNAAAACARYLAFDEQQQPPRGCPQGTIRRALRSFRH